MQVASFSDASSLLQIGAKMADHFDVHKAREEVVTVERLDDYATDQGMPMPDLIKLDVQGYELESLRGGLGCLRHARCTYRRFHSSNSTPGNAFLKRLLNLWPRRVFGLIRLPSQPASDSR